MNVRELREALAAFPDDMPVVSYYSWDYGENGGFTQIEQVNKQVESITYFEKISDFVSSQKETPQQDVVVLA